MKRFFSVLVLTGVLLQSLSSFVIVAHYEWNKKYIAANFCENKAKPKLKCHGKCQLRKQLKEQTQREQIPASPLKDKTELIQYYSDNVEAVSSFRSYFLMHFPFSYMEGNSFQFIVSIFHPPSNFLTLS